MLFIEKENNSIIFNEDGFKPQHNYMSDLVLALRELDRERPINFAIDLEKAPLMFIVYFRKLKQTDNNLELNLYFKDSSEILPSVLKSYNLNYKNINEYPWELPNGNNVVAIVDPVDDLETEQNLEDLSKIPDVYYLEDD